MVDNLCRCFNIMYKKNLCKLFDIIMILHDNAASYLGFVPIHLLHQQHFPAHALGPHLSCPQPLQDSCRHH